MSATEFTPDLPSSHAMLVLSVANRSFTSELISASLQLLMTVHPQVSIIVADELMIYNKFQISQERRAVGRIIQQYKSDRINQVNRILAKLDLDHLVHKDRIRVMPYNDFCDAKYAYVFRRLLLLADADDDIRQALRRMSAEYLTRHAGADRPHDTTASEFASFLFLVDEAAWTIHLSAHHGITDNYYPGDVGEVLKIFYLHQTLDIFQILDIPRHVHRFWKLTEDYDRVVPQLMWEVPVSSWM